MKPEAVKYGRIMSTPPGATLPGQKPTAARVSQILKEITHQIKTAGIARLDLTAEEYGAIHRAKELILLGSRVTATPENMHAGQIGLTEATHARVCWTARGYKLPAPNVLKWFQDRTAASKYAERQQIKNPYAVVTCEPGRPFKIFNDPRPVAPKEMGRNSWAVCIWSVEEYFSAFFRAYYPSEIFSLFREMKSKVSGDVWELEKRQSKGGQSTKAKGEITRKRILDAVAKMREKYPKRPYSMIRSMLARKQPIAYDKAGKKVFYPRRKGFSSGNIYKYAGDLE